MRNNGVDNCKRCSVKTETRRQKNDDELSERHVFLVNMELLKNSNGFHRNKLKRKDMHRRRPRTMISENILPYFDIKEEHGVESMLMGNWGLPVTWGSQLITPV